jgi:putative methyltransferase
MSAACRKNVLISEPQLMEMGIPYLPVMWGILKTYWERLGPGGDDVTWLPPIHRMGDATSLLSAYGDTPIHVLGLSCYTWNWRLQLQIAQQVKSRHPDCLIIAGGPEPDYKDPAFFARYPCIDMIAVKDGEITFNRILQRVLARGDARGLPGDSALFLDVPGLYLPGPDGSAHICTGPAEVPSVFEHSPYIAQSAYYEELRRTLSSNVIAVWETNRGCPYRCSFCDWGSSTMSKLRLFDMARLEAEIEWFGRTKVGFIMLADANFGILPRDLTLLDRVVAANEKFGYPTYFSYNTAKNNPDRTVAIAKKLIGSGLSSAHVLSIQHTNERVLAATERANISTAKQIEVVRELMADDIPIYVQLIMGIPGDTYGTWKSCFTDLMEWGIHAHYWVFPYNLLPNAPAAEAQYRERWKIRTLDRYVLLNHGLRMLGPMDPVLEAKSRLIVETSTFSRADWVKMSAYAACIKALHNCAVTQSIAVYMRFTHDLPYARFYEDLIEGFFAGAEPSRGWYQAVLAHHQRYLDEEDAIDFMAIPQLPGFPYHIDPGRWLFVQICFAIDAFFEALQEHLVRRYPAAASLESLVAYQKNLIVLPSYDRQRGKVFVTDHDWPTYFAEAQRRLVPARLPEPAPTPGAVLAVGDQTWSDERMTRPLDWTAGSEDERWARWIHATVTGRNSIRKNNFQELRRLSSGAIATGPSAPDAPKPRRLPITR